MSLGNHHFARYDLYKAGTIRFTSWVITTAASVGCGDTKLKDTRVTVAKLKQCVDAVVQSSVIIPSNITELLEGVIIGRQLCADWYCAQSDSDAEENQSHQHFIDVLRDILQSLNDKRRSQRNQATTFPQNAPPPADETRNDWEAITNVYDILKAEDVSVEPLGSATLALNPPKQYRARVRTHTLETKSEDAFMHFCVLKDLHDLRNLVIEAWKEHASGTLSYFVATSVTREAFKSMFFVVSDLETKTGANIDPMEVVRSLKLSLDKQEQEDGAWQFRFVGSQSSESSSFSEMLCPLAVVTLTELTREYDLCRSKFRKGRYHTYSPSTEAIEFAKKAHPFVETLFACLPETWSNEPENRDLPINSNDCVFVQLLRKMQRQSRFTLADVSVCQSYIDIIDMFHGDFTFGECEYSNAIERLKDTTSTFADFVTKDSSDPSSSKKGETSSDVSRYVEREANLHDIVVSEKTGEKAAKGPKDMLTREAVLLRAFPMHMAARVRNIVLETHRASCATSNHDLFVQFFAYMYRAAVWANLTPEWPDMQRLIANQARSHGSALVQDVPPHGDFAHFHNHLSMYLNGSSALGKTTKASALEARRKRSPVISSGIEFLATQASIKAKYPKQRNKPNDVDYEQLAVDEMARKAGATSVVKRLEAFKFAWVRDESELYFDYFAVWKECKKLLDKIWDICYKNPGMIKMDQFDSRVELVRGILLEVMTHQMSEGVHTDLRATKLGMVAEKLQKLVKTSGDWVGIEAEEICRQSRERFVSGGKIASEQDEEKEIWGLTDLSIKEKSDGDRGLDCSRPTESTQVARSWQSLDARD